MTTFGDLVYQLGGVPVGSPLTQGNVIHLKPGNGDDGNMGTDPKEDAVATWTRALALVEADKNSIVYVYSEDNSASGTTDYQSATLTLNKDGVKYIGVNSGNLFAQRSRIAQLSTALAVGPLVTFSASNCFMSNISVYHGVDDSTSGVAAISVTGDRNHFYRCHFAGIGHDTMDTGNNCSLSLTGDENLFEECVIGLDTISRGTASNSEIYFPAAGDANRNVFKNCIITTFAGAATHQFIVTGAGSLSRFQLFDNCTFVNDVAATASTMTEAFDVSATQGGSIVLKDCVLVGCTEWEAGDAGNVFCCGPIGAAATTGIAIEPAV